MTSFNPNDPFPQDEGKDTIPDILGGFPRHLTTELIEEREGLLAGREVLAGWIIGIALALLALALPQERLIGNAFAAPFEQGLAWGIWISAGEGLGNLLGLHGEQGRFILAALAYGACLPVALGLARRLGCPFGLALIANSILLFTPTAWLAATTPGLGSLSLLLLLGLMRQLWDPDARNPWICLSIWGLLTCSQYSALLLLPAVLWACVEFEENPKRKPLIIGIGIIASGVFIKSFSDLPAGHGFLDEVLWMRFAGLLPGIGFALAGLASLWLLKRNESELPPPRWLLVWSLLPLAFLSLSSSLAWDASYLWLLPVALIGIFDVLARSDLSTAIPLGLGTLVAQLALLFGFQSYAANTDPLTDWRASASEFLEPGDIFLSADQAHSYLAAERWGLETVPLEGESIEEVRLRLESGKRVILDPSVPSELESKSADLEHRLAAHPNFHVLRKARDQ
ncbi:MAG: hypothetical protein ACI835_005257 [Planctomycetota bacterium]|jgi:hypothetical protein